MTKANINLEHKNTTTKNKARFGCLIQPLVWKWDRPFMAPRAHTWQAATVNIY